ncbi:MAG: low molecular weight phosphotyrosine protein phosphatase [Bacteroidaceae bacterium]|nr:low molecular weight phosphotyrosine protein phosphatase [Bacteroidaceae bacterium]
MKKIMFVCHGNICRSPMAEYVMKSLAAKKSVGEELYIDSSATSREEIGNAVYPPAANTLSMHGIESKGHKAKQFSVADYNDFDMVIVMEEYNKRNLMRLIGCDCENKVWKLLDFTLEEPISGAGADISDPWYHGGFDKTYNEIVAGCKGLMRYLGY